MKILYYTSGITGTGRIVLGISIFNAFARRGQDCEFTILSNAPKERVHIIDIFNIHHIEIFKGNPDNLSKNNYRNSILYRTITQLIPDILIIDRMWFTLYNFIDALNCKKIYLTQQVIDQYYSIELPQGTLNFNPDQYHKLISIEPYKSPFAMTEINPIIIRNKNEILDRRTALEKLGISGKRRTCLIAINYKEEYFSKLKDKYSYLENEFDVIYTTNMGGRGIFPVVDYFNAFDLIICPAGYNQFWEVIFFNKEAVFEPVPNQFEDQQKRIDECQEYYFEENGADQLVDIIMNL